MITKIFINNIFSFRIKIYLSSVVSADRFAVKFDYSSILLKEIVYLLRENLVDSCLEFMEHYNITPEVLKENLVDIQFNPKKIDFFAGITTATKSSLTKLYNKAHKETFKGKKSKKISDENNERGIRNILGEEDGKNDWEEEEENVNYFFKFCCFHKNLFFFFLSRKLIVTNTSLLSKF